MEGSFKWTSDQTKRPTKPPLPSNHYRSGKEHVADKNKSFHHPKTEHEEVRRTNDPSDHAATRFGDAIELQILSPSSSASPSSLPQSSPPPRPPPSLGQFESGYKKACSVFEKTKQVTGESYPPEFGKPPLFPSLASSSAATTAAENFESRNAHGQSSVHTLPINKESIGFGGASSDNLLVVMKSSLAEHNHVKHKGADEKGHVIQSDSQNDPKQSSCKIYDPRIRWLILLLACWIMFGNYYAFDNPSALNRQLHEWLSNPSDPHSAFQYRLNLLYSVYSVPNVVLPLLVGRWMESFGNQSFLLILSLLSCCGQALFAWGVQSRTFWLAVLGRIVFGLGGESLAVSQARIVTEWFTGRELALAIGLNLSISRVGLICNNNISPRIALRWGVPAALWVGFGSCVLSMICTIIAIVIDRNCRDPNLGKHLDDDDEYEDYEEGEGIVPEADVEKATEIKREKGYGNLDLERVAQDGQLNRKDCWTTSNSNLIMGEHDRKRNATMLPKRKRRPNIHPVFWMLVIMCFLFYSDMIPYNNVASDYLQARYYPNDPLTANLAMSIPDTLAMFLVPLMGTWVDRTGRKLATLAIGCLSFLVGHFTLALGEQRHGGLLSLTVLGIGYSTMLMFWACVPKLVKPKRHALAYGILTSAMNLAVTIVPIFVAFLINQDETYRLCGLFFASLGFFSLILAVSLVFVNQKLHLHLNHRVVLPLPPIIDASVLPVLAIIEAEEMRRQEPDNNEEELSSSSNTGGEDSTEGSDRGGMLASVLMRDGKESDDNDDGGDAGSGKREREILIKGKALAHPSLLDMLDASNPLGSLDSLEPQSPLEPLSDCSSVDLSLTTRY